LDFFIFARFYDFFTCVARADMYNWVALPV